MLAKQCLFVCIGTLLLTGLSGCDIDKNHPKYDELRYEQLQKARCGEMASVLAAPFFMDEPEDFDVARKRCEDTKTLSFDEYKRLADYGRTTGAWDLYAIFPEKQ